MYERNAKVWYKHIDFILIDILSALLSFSLAYSIRFGNTKGIKSLEGYIGLLYIMLLSILVMGLVIRNHKNILRRGYFKELIKVLELSLCGLAFTSLTLYATKLGSTYSRLHVLYSAVIFVVIDYCFRVFWKSIVKRFKLFSIRKDERRILIVSDKERVKAFIDVLNEEGKYSNIQIAGLVLLNSDEKTYEGLEVVSSITEAAEYVCHNWIDEVLTDSDSSSEKRKDFESDCLKMGVSVHRLSFNDEVTEGKVFVEKFGKQTVLTITYATISAWESILKRLIDIVGGIVGCIITLLLTIIIGPIIYVNSPGPIFFKQQRVGKNGKVFDFFKFRSMCLDAEEKKAALASENRNEDGMMFKMDFDPRIIGNEILPDGTKKTGIGDFIRRTSLDEFPQFWNVLKGDMSLVGTRPPTLDEWSKYKYNHKARLAVKPGITGLWQVSGRSEITNFEDTVKLDTEYIKNYSLGLDIKILIKTVVVLFTKRGAK